jgi:hypothetical protein
MMMPSNQRYKYLKRNSFNQGKKLVFTFQGYDFWTLPLDFLEASIGVLMKYT